MVLVDQDRNFVANKNGKVKQATKTTISGKYAHYLDRQFYVARSIVKDATYSVFSKVFNLIIEILIEYR